MEFVVEDEVGMISIRFRIVNGGFSDKVGFGFILFTVGDEV